MIQIRRIRRTTDSGSSRLELELGREDHRLVEVRLAVGEAEVVALADLDLVGGVDDGGPADELADRPLAAAGVAAQGAADGAGDAGQDLQPGQAGAGRLRDQGRQRDRGAGLDDVAARPSRRRRPGSPGG